MQNTGIVFWAPLAILATLALLWMSNTIRRRRDQSIPVGSGEKYRRFGREGYLAALREALELNSYDPRIHSNPTVHLNAIARLAPISFRVSTRDLVHQYRLGRVISIDIGKMDEEQSARMIDFCSGIAAGSGGWLVQISEDVVVLTPRA
ncbi:cell division protein SepF [Nocardia sp. NPDC101769]|uniref:cell division protein SepF n=1 Tax=Nocardia sp. NPDC101769 TaxID=3364333 RepID=UPI0038120EC1